jgi:hypothetical protein
MIGARHDAKYRDFILKKPDWRILGLWHQRVRHQRAKTSPPAAPPFTAVTPDPAYLGVSLVQRLRFFWAMKLHNPEKVHAIIDDADRAAGA